MKLYSSGFSLLELLLVTSLICVFSTIAFPSLSRYLAQNRAEMSINSIFKILMLARAFAVSNSTNITICPLSQGSCKKNWQKDLYVFEDKNGNLRLDDHDKIIKVLRKVESLELLTYPRTAITYRPDGSIRALQSGSFVYCNKHFKELKRNQITVSQAGRIRIIDSSRCDT